ncbi:DUF92 domain-containing protein [Halorarum halobium]|uniref:DUF92 domain-containing protein n=1 Tax=Halorarum halobium TaxID=3075121 RepID=UPI0028A697CB|nr:DUF92 domain-containing protein [Halobaculum sp. XH14]
MTHRLRRAGAFAAVGTLVLAAPVLGPAAAAPFAAVAVLAVFVIEDGFLFELFARPGDREDRRLNGLAGFALAAAGLGVLTVDFPSAPPMPDTVFAAAVLTLAFGNLGRELVRERTTDEFALVVGFVTAGTLAGSAGQAFVAAVAGEFAVRAVPEFAFLAAVGTLVAALLRSILFGRDDPLVMISVGFLLWLFHVLTGTVPASLVAVGLGLAVALGWVSYALDAASVPGMLTGVLLAALSVVLGGYGWFAVLISFFSVGALATKYRYEEKRARGVAEENDGARGTGNVLGNAAVALFAVVGSAAADRLLDPTLPLADVAPTLLAFAFAGSVAAAMADTLSSEFGGLYDDPRLVTTFERVEPGTDGAITWQGEVAGLAGAALVGGIAASLMSLGDPLPALVVVTLAGVVGMTVDSVLGATVEGESLTNQTVNFLATLAGGLAGVALAVPFV